jgi:hypothetical protein
MITEFSIAIKHNMLSMELKSDEETMHRIMGELINKIACENMKPEGPATEHEFAGSDLNYELQ